MEIITRYKNYGEDYKHIKSQILEVEKEMQALNKERKRQQRIEQFDMKNWIYQYYYLIYTLSMLVTHMQQVNDFEASMMAEKYTIKRLDNFIDFLGQKLKAIEEIDIKKRYESKREKKIKEDYEIVKEFCESCVPEIATIKKGGQKVQISNFQFLADTLYWEQVRIGARYLIHYNIIYLERTKQAKDYPSRQRVLEAFVHFANQGMLNRFGLSLPNEEIRPTQIIFSTMPSSGKSYVINTLNEMSSILGAMLKNIGGVLRVGNEQGNIFRQSRQTMNLIENPYTRDIYPEMNYWTRANGKFDPFEKNSEEEWGIRGVDNDPATSVFKTRDSAVNSVRCFLFGCYDDPSRGDSEKNNVEKHKEIAQKFNGDFKDRFKSQDDMFIILTGTMFNPEDVFSQEIEKAKKKGMYKDERFLNTWISNDKKTVIIINDCEDENGNSAFPEFISTQALMEKKESLDPYQYACTWRQRPIPPDGLLFEKTLLRTYKELPVKHLTDYTFAYLDPTRRTASDFLSMPIFKYNNVDGLFYLVDCIYEQKSSKDNYDKIINKIIENKMLKFRIESNTSEDLDTVIKDRLKNKNYKTCQVTTKYNTVNKAMRIADFAEIIKKNVVFPDLDTLPKKSEMYNLVKDLTEYSSVNPRKHDDSPDSFAGFAEAFIHEAQHENIVKLGSLPF